MNSNFLFNGQFEKFKYPRLYAQRDNYVSRLGLDRKITAHNGCINTLSWSDINCNYLLSGSDDQYLTITDAFSGTQKVSVHTAHRANIFSAKFLPKSDDKRLISSSADGSIYLTDLNYNEIVNNQNSFLCHGNKTCFEVRTFIDDPFIFISCGQDGCCKWIDLRQSSKCENSSCQEHSLIKISSGISAIAINPFVPYHMVCAGMDGIVRFYDRRMLSVGVQPNVETISSLTDQSTRGLFATFAVANSELNSPVNTCNIPGNTVTSNKRITSLQYNNWGTELLVSCQTDHIYLLDWRDLSLENKNEISTNSDIEMNQASDNFANSPAMSTPGKKFRIQTDWSDTGPNSHPIEDSNNLDPRTYLMRRLNDWFSDLYQSRTHSQSTTTNSQQQSSTINSETNILNEAETNDHNDRVKKRNIASNLNDINDDDDNEIDKHENLRMLNENKTEQIKKTRPSLSPTTSNLMCSRIRAKQAMKLESNIIKKQPSPKIKMIYTGHRNARTIIKECNFWGNDHIISGSDCGHIFFWNKHSGKIVNIIEADKRVVNCVQENPLHPVLASSGIDYDIKIWQPILESPVDMNSKIDLITQRNRLMLNENRQTIFIPVQFMVPALRLFGANMRNNNENQGNNEGANNIDSNDN